jgi:hypothetical protein
MRRAALAVLFACVGAQANAQPGTLPAATLEHFPHVGISNGLLSAQIYPPGDMEMYRGMRFDHAGVVLHITYKGVDTSNYWFDRYVVDPNDPGKYPLNVQTACCAVSGPVEEFEPVGFDAAGDGGRFLKIGVGILKRHGDTYGQGTPYTILNAGTRGFKATTTGAHFTQDVKDAASGYGYHYEKSVQLTPGKPQLILAHTLTNTGSKPIVTVVYNHNFLTLSPGNEHIVIAAPFNLAATQPLQPDILKIEGKTVRYLAPVKPGDHTISLMTGFGDKVSDYDFRVTNSATGYGVRIRADQPVARINFWSVNTILGWEPYIAIALKPGETKLWTNTYDYYGPDK